MISTTTCSLCCPRINWNVTRISRCGIYYRFCTFHIRHIVCPQETICLLTPIPRQLHPRVYYTLDLTNQQKRNSSCFEHKWRKHACRRRYDKRVSQTVGPIPDQGNSNITHTPYEHRRLLKNSWFVILLQTGPHYP
jgi:hypothetical protein